MSREGHIDEGRRLIREGVGSERQAFDTFRSPDERPSHPGPSTAPVANHPGHSTAPVASHPHRSTTPVAVIGAGAVGLAVAEALTARGVEVVVFEAGRVGAGASAGNAGWITPSLATPLPAPGVIGPALRWLTRGSSPLWIRPTLEPAVLGWLARFALASRRAVHARGLAALQALAADAGPAYDRLAGRGASFERHVEPLLYPAFSAHELRDLRRAAAALATTPAAATMHELTGAQLRALEPALAESVCGGMLAPGESRVRPEGLTAALGNLLRRRGVEIESGSAVAAITRRPGGWRIATAAAEHDAREVVLANGVGARRLLRAHGVHLPILTAKGYSRTFARAADDGGPRRALYLEGPRVAISPFQAAVRLSGAFELGARRLDLSPARLHAITAAARDALPGWSPRDRAQDWAGMRAVSPDGVPYIGPVPGCPGLHIATAHAMLGITLAPLSAEIVVRRMLDGADDPLTQAVDPARALARRAAA